MTAGFWKKSGDHQKGPRESDDRPKRAKPSVLSPSSRILVCRYMWNVFDWRVRLHLIWSGTSQWR